MFSKKTPVARSLEPGAEGSQQVEHALGKSLFRCARRLGCPLMRSFRQLPGPACVSASGCRPVTWPTRRSVPGQGFAWQPFPRGTSPLQPRRHRRKSRASTASNHPETGRISLQDLAFPRKEPTAVTSACSHKPRGAFVHFGGFKLCEPSRFRTRRTATRIVAPVHDLDRVLGIRLPGHCRWPRQFASFLVTLLKMR